MLLLPPAITIARCCAQVFTPTPTTTYPHPRPKHAPTPQGACVTDAAHEGGALGVMYDVRCTDEGTAMATSQGGTVLSMHRI